MTHPTPTLTIEVDKHFLMTYDEAKILLINNHIYPLKIVKDLKTEKVLSIEVECSGIMKDSKLEYLKKLLGEADWKYTWFPNQSHIEIVHKKK